MSSTSCSPTSWWPTASPAFARSRPWPRRTTRKSIPHHGGGNLGTIAQLHAIASWPHAPWIEILHDPPVAAYTNGFSIMENPPLVDKEGYMTLPQGPGLGVTVNKDLLA